MTPLALAALLLLAACGSDSGGVVADGPPSTTTTTASTTTSTSADAECSTSGVRLVLADQDLPAPVAEKRQAIFDAAVACDFDALAAEAGDEFNFTFGNPGEGPAAHWRQQEQEGHAVLLPLARVLNLPSAERDELEGKPFRSWPSADQEHRTQADWDALRGLYTDEQVEQFQAADSYTGWRTAITDAGDWMYFVAGD
jgi:hypothetical protein